MKKEFVFDYPTPDLVKEYVKEFDEGNNREDYYKDEAIKKLFDLLPNNTMIDEVLAKVTLLNNFYGTQILNIDSVNVASDIVSMNIDNKLGRNGKKVEISVVNQIAYEMENYHRSLYSFASKYCSFHNQSAFPIADSFAKGMLYYMNCSKDEKFRFFPVQFTQSALNNYHNYCKVYRAFIKHFGLEEMSYKEIDKYLWKYAKYEMGTRIQITDSSYDPYKLLYLKKKSP